MSYLVIYTTRYREGGVENQRAAKTFAGELAEARKGETLIRRVESKKAFVDALREASRSEKGLQELHFFGHSGVYGPMFGTRDYPEQLSPHEWRQLVNELRWSKDGEAFFHACRTARWFAQFFADTFRVPASGYFWYTTFSRRADVFRWEWGGLSGSGPLYLFGLPGRKSHGWWGSLKKYLGFTPPEPLQRFLPTEYEEGSAGRALKGKYDAVARSYGQTFEDFGVRADESLYLIERVKAHVQEQGPCRIADLGTGNGSLLRLLVQRGLVKEAWGFDNSAAMLEVAVAQSQSWKNLHFQRMNGPQISLDDASVDIVVSCLSFRYLDWEPIVSEVRRILRPGGVFLVVDMVNAPCRWRQWPRVLRDLARVRVLHLKEAKFRRSLRAMVSSPEWQEMLHYNPIRSEHEMLWFLESRFVGGQSRILNCGPDNRVVAFDSGPLGDER
ncbi:MAG: class I SAM-dependent methyltransferase [Polyangiaceae bacterium]|nr:class I SAM-dependent methyltransferase [Polyangiaceae bacterium]